MTITPSELLDTSTAQLQILVAFLRDQLGETGGRLDVESDDSEVRACREVLLLLSTLIPKLQVGRCAQPSVPPGVSGLHGNVSFFTHYASARERVAR